MRWSCACGLLVALATLPTLGVKAEAARSQAVAATDAVDITLLTSEAGVPRNARTLSGGLRIELDEGWKTYWRSPGEVGIPPSLDWGGSINIAAAEILWPAPERFRAFGIENFGYSGEIVLPLQITLERPGEPVALRARVSLLVCSTVCVPASADLALDLGPGKHIDMRDADMIAASAARVPGPGETSGVRLVSAAASGEALVVALDAASAWQTPDLFPEIEGVTFGPPDIRKGPEGLLWARLDARVAMPDEGKLRLTVTDGARAVELQGALGGPPASPPSKGAAPGIDWRRLTWGMVLGVLGGLVLNAMPCVLPVIGLKLGSVLHATRREAVEVRRGFVASAAGVFAFVWGLAVALIVARSLGATIGWGVQFQNPSFLAFAAVVLVLFAANAAELVRIELPTALSNRLARAGGRHGYAGDFATGAFGALLATPCSAPFVGTAVAFALASGPIEIAAIFTALGLGLAAPYLVVAARPSLVARLPRPGPWMVWLRRAMALLLAGTAAWLLWVLVGVAGGRVAVLIGVMAVLASATLSLGRLREERRPAMGLLSAAFGVLATLAVVVPQAFVPEARAVVSSAGIPWTPFAQGDIARRVSRGETVFVDVTADWCVTCKANKALVLERGAVAEALSGGSVAPMQADWTRPDAAIARYLKAHERYGIPFNAVYGPAAPEGVVLPELLSTQGVMGALDVAGWRSSLTVRDPGS